MKNIKTYNQVNQSVQQSFSYRIDWSLFEGEIEYDYITEELKVVFTTHGEDQASNYKIDPSEIEELIGSISNMLINAYNKYENNLNKEIVCSIRDRSKKIPFEIITIIENEKEKQVKKENVAITGEMYSYSKVKKLEDEVVNKGMHTEDELGSNGRRTRNPKRAFIELLDRKESSEGFVVNPEDYVFKVITTRRKKDFIPNTPGQIVFDIFPNNVKKMNGDDLRTSMM
jgi:hypothetical protein